MSEEPLYIPKLKGVEALLQKTKAAAAGDPAPSSLPPRNEVPTEAPAAQPDPEVYKAVELEQLEAELETKASFDACVVRKLLNTLGKHIQGAQQAIKQLQQEGATMHHMLLAACMARGGSLHIQGACLRKVMTLDREKRPPALAISKAKDGVDLTAKIPDAPIVIAQQMPAPNGGKN